MTDTNGVENKSRQVMEAYIKLRDKRTKLKEAYEKVDGKYKDQMYKLEIYLLKQMEAAGSDTIKNEVGTAYISVTKRYSCADWPGFWGWIVENGRPDMLEKRVLSSAINEFVEEKKELPPFLNVFAERNINVRRK